MICLFFVLSCPTQFMNGYAFSRNEGKSSEKRKRSMLDDDPCLDAQEVNILDSVEFLPRYVDLTRPWLRNDITPKIFTSSGLQYQWAWVKSLAVRGLPNDTTIDDVLRHLDGQNCSFLATGHAVWQTVQRTHPVKIEGEISCSLPHVYSVCIQKYGTESCSLYPNLGDDHQYRVEIGDARSNRSIHQLYAEPLVLFEWGSMLRLPTLRWSYTVMTMAIYDNSAGQVYLVDMTGRGYADTCGKRLAATVDDTKWLEWADGDIEKAYEFYLLRTMGFGVSNHDLQNLVNSVIEREHTKKAAQTFYCESILHGVISWTDDNLTTTCHLIYPEHFARKQIAKAREILQNEMAGHWKQFMGEVIDEMEAVYLTEQQFIEARNRIKGRISGESDNELLKNIEIVNELISHEQQPHYDSLSASSAGLNPLPISSVEQHTSIISNTDPFERSGNNSEWNNLAKSIVQSQFYARSQCADIVIQFSILASAIFSSFWNFF